MVCVVPGKLPAKVIVAPNSPSARAHDSTAKEIAISTSASTIASSGFVSSDR